MWSSALAAFLCYGWGRNARIESYDIDSYVI